MKSDIMYNSNDSHAPYINCVINNCKERPVWGINWSPKHCGTHKLYDEQYFVEKKCVLCGYIYIVNNENKCQKCKLSDVPIHPHFTIRPPGQRRKTLGTPDVLSTTLRLTRSSPDILSTNVILDKTNPVRSKTQAELQTAITIAKKKLKATRERLEQYSSTDMSVSKIAARDEYTMHEKEVEDASKAWRQACRLHH